MGPRILKPVTATVLVILLLIVGYGIYETVKPTPQYDVTIRYTERFAEQIDTWAPSQGHTFLVVNLDIENHGDRKFTADPMYFKVIANNVEYGYDHVTLMLDNRLKSFVELHKNGRISGSIVFEIPEGTTEYTLTYTGLGNWKINWIHY